MPFSHRNRAGGEGSHSRRDARAVVKLPILSILQPTLFECKVLRERRGLAPGANCPTTSHNDYTGLTRKQQKKETTVTSSCHWNNNSRGRQDDASIAWPSAICGGRHRTRPGADNDGASLVHEAPVAERATGEEPTALAIGPRDPERV